MCCIPGPAQFATCSLKDSENVNIPQVGCSRVEKLSSTVGQLVEFNIALIESPRHC